MRLWPFGKKEQRSYTGLLVGGFEAAASGDQSGRSVLSTAAYESAVGLVSRCLAAGESSHRALTPAHLGTIGRELLRTGECFFRIDVRSGRVVLVQLSDVYLTGTTANPDDWTYKGSEYGPSGTTTMTMPATRVLHFRYSIDTSRPWIGVPPWKWASLSSRGLGAAETVAANRAGAAHGDFVASAAVPDFRDRQRLSELSQRYQCHAPAPHPQRRAPVGIPGPDRAIVSVGHFRAETLPKSNRCADHPRGRMIAMATARKSAGPRHDRGGRRTASEWLRKNRTCSRSLRCGYS